MDSYDKQESSLTLTLGGIVKLLPEALRFPHLAGVRILMAPFSYETKGYMTTDWGLKFDIKSFDDSVGNLEISYSEETDIQHDGPFTADEVMLFEYIAGRISRIVERLLTRKKLNSESRALREANTTLGRVLKHIRTEQSEIGRTIQTNINRVVIPMLNSSAHGLPPQRRALLDAAIRNMEEIASPFTSVLEQRFMALSPQELVVCNLLREGMSSKDIADARGVSFNTVNNFRRSIRKKLGLANKKVNLRVYLANNFNA